VTRFTAVAYDCSHAVNTPRPRHHRDALLGHVCQFSQGATYRIDHVTDGDTVVLRNGQKVRLVQIDTPEVYFGTECYGRQASATTKRLLPEGVRVRLLPEPATDRIDGFGRLLRYVVRAREGVNVNVHLVALGAAAP
jgi:endonuclease YncB( thermonuclease family)